MVNEEIESKEDEIKKEIKRLEKLEVSYKEISLLMYIYIYILCFNFIEKRL